MGSVWAHIKTGKSPMAHDHFKTPPDPKRGYSRPKKSQKSLKVRAKPAKHKMTHWLSGTAKQAPDRVISAPTQNNQSSGRYAKPKQICKGISGWRPPLEKKTIFCWFWIFMALLGAKGVLKMIVSHRAPSSFNMSSGTISNQIPWLS